MAYRLRSGDMGGERRKTVENIGGKERQARNERRRGERGPGVSRFKGALARGSCDRSTWREGLGASPRQDSSSFSGINGVYYEASLEGAGRGPGLA